MTNASHLSYACYPIEKNRKLAQNVCITSNRKIGGGLAACFLFPLLVFGQIRRHEFVLIDDNVHLQENRYLQPPTWKNTKGFWRAPFLGLYIPVTYSLWSAEAKLAYSAQGKGLDPGVFHEVSIALHAANTVLCFLLFLSLMEPFAALLAALFFSLHPVQAEAVAWASAQKDLLCGFFSLLALWQYTRFCQDRRRVRYAVATVSFLLALLSKPASVGLAAVAWAIEVGVIGRKPKDSFKWLWPWLFLAIPILGITKVLQPDQHIGPVLPWWQRPLIAFDTLAFYIAKTIVPIRLAPDYSRAPDVLIHHWMAYFSWLIPLIFGFLFARKVRGWHFIAIIFIAGILPVLGLVPFYFQVFSTVADRYLYLSLLSPALVFGRLLPPRFWGRLAGCAVLVVFSLLSFEQAGKWRDSLTLFEHTLKVNPGSLLAHNNLGAILEEKGRYDEAYKHYASSVKLAPDSVPPLYNIARLQAMKGNFKLAKPLFYEVLRMQPDVAEAHQSLGAIFAKEKNWNEAEKHLMIALQIRPESEKIRDLLKSVQDNRANLKKN